jgi:hypothetical protein
VVLGWRAGRPGPAPQAAVDKTPWAVPAPAAADPARDAAILRARWPWGGTVAFRDIDAGPPAAPSQPWALVGTIARDAERFALIRVGPGPAGRIEYRGVGDKMPDGSRLDEIAGDSVTTQAGGNAAPVVHRLFDKRP